MVKHSRKRRRNPISTILVALLTFALGLVVLYFFTIGIGLTEVQALLQDFLQSRWEVLTVQPIG